MTTASDFTKELESKVAQQLKSQRVGYLLGAGSSYLNGAGYPLAFELWDLIKGTISDVTKRADIQAKRSGPTRLDSSEAFLRCNPCGLRVIHGGARVAHATHTSARRGG